MFSDDSIDPADDAAPLASDAGATAPAPSGHTASAAPGSGDAFSTSRSSR